MKLTVWSTPSYYFGFSPVGDYLLYSKNRDSSLLDESNFDAIKKSFKHLNIDAPQFEYSTGDESLGGYLYEFRASHCIVGYVDYLLLRQDAPQEYLDIATAVEDRLDCYPILDEQDYGERQHDTIISFWFSLPIRDRIEKCKDCGESIFSARSLPESVYSCLMDEIV